MDIWALVLARRECNPISQDAGGTPPQLRRANYEPKFNPDYLFADEGPDAVARVRCEAFAGQPACEVHLARVPLERFPMEQRDGQTGRRIMSTFAYRTTERTRGSLCFAGMRWSRAYYYVACASDVPRAPPAEELAWREQAVRYLDFITGVMRAVWGDGVRRDPDYETRTCDRLQQAVEFEVMSLGEFPYNCGLCKREVKQRVYWTALDTGPREREPDAWRVQQIARRISAPGTEFIARVIHVDGERAVAWTLPCHDCQSS